MTKLKNPLFSLRASGSLAKVIAFTRRRRQNIAEKMPVPEDAKSLAQLSWRHMYQKAVALWHALSPAEKQEWESLARPKHMTGFAWFVSQALKPNPGLYLPLQGGTMSGDIAMAGNKVTGLAAAVAAGEAVRYNEYLAHTINKKAHTQNILEVVRTGDGYYSGYSRGAAMAAALDGDRLYGIALIVVRTITFDRIAIEVVTVEAGKSIRLGVYELGTNLLPGALLLDAGFINAGSGGVRPINIDLQLEPGIYFTACLSDSTGTVKVRRAAVLGAPLGRQATKLASVEGGWCKVQAYGVLPDPFPATPWKSAGNVPLILLRPSSLD